MPHYLSSPPSEAAVDIATAQSDHSHMNEPHYFQLTPPSLSVDKSGTGTTRQILPSLHGETADRHTATHRPLSQSEHSQLSHYSHVLPSPSPSSSGGGKTASSVFSEASQNSSQPLPPLPGEPTVMHSLPHSDHSQPSHYSQATPASPSPFWGKHTTSQPLPPLPGESVVDSLPTQSKHNHASYYPRIITHLSSSSLSAYQPRPPFQRETLVNGSQTHSEQSTAAAFSQLPLTSQSFSGDSNKPNTAHPLSSLAGMSPVASSPGVKSTNVLCDSKSDSDYHSPQTDRAWYLD